MIEFNLTHDADLRSWVDSANQPGCDFPIQNLPFGVFRRRDSLEAFRGGVAIGNQILDLGEVRDGTPRGKWTMKVASISAWAEYADAL
jgi:fumarylacetoacetase